MPNFRPIPGTRVAVAALATVMIISVIPATAMAGTSSAAREAEWDVLGQINHYRVSRGLTPVRMAHAARSAARTRSIDMRDANVLSHSSPYGRDAASLLAKLGVKYQAGAENIGRATFINWDTAVGGIMIGWQGSSSHNATMLSRKYNYVGIGVAKGNGMAYITTIFLKQKDHTAPKAGLIVKQRDRTAPKAGMVAASTGFAVAARDDGKRRVTVRWWGRDPRTAVNHSGIKRFVIQHKRVGGKKGWQTIRKATLKHSLRMTLTKGRHKFRVRAIDRAGNVGKWHRPVLFRVT